MSNSIPTEPVYRTCYCYDSSIGKMTYRTYNYTEMLEKMANSSPPEGITYWEPDEYGRVYIDPKHPMQASLEPVNPSSIQLPAAVPAALPSVRNCRTEEQQKAQEEQALRFREELERMARQEALLHRIAMSILSAER